MNSRIKIIILSVVAVVLSALFHWLGAMIPTLLSVTAVNRHVPGALETTYVFVVARHCCLAFIFVSLLYTLRKHGRVEMSFLSLRKRLLAHS